MKIVSSKDYLVAYPSPLSHWIEWTKGSHYAHIISPAGKEVDVFSFAWEKNRPSMLDFTTALQSYLDYSEE